MSDDVIQAAHDGADRPAAKTIPVASLWWWSVRRELWENRSIVIAPLVVATLVVIGFIVRALHFAELRRSGVEGSEPRDLLASPAHVVAVIIVATAVLVGVFYCLDALHGERSDRSILFWKSLPVSDLVTVLSKAGIPLVVLPLLAFVTVVVTQVLMLTSTALILGADAVGSLLPLVQLTWTLLYALVVLALWHAPVYAYLLLVSSVAKRMTFVTAILPLLLLSIVERIAFGTSWLAHAIKQRLFGFAEVAFTSRSGSLLPYPQELLTSAALWVGLVLAAVLIGATVWSRRRNGPL